jgi:subtilisin family serine protease
VNVRSSLPGGAYGQMGGTSMAAPHVSGIVALLRSVSPTLDIMRAPFFITSTVVPLGAPVPNNDAGWGRVDAFAAVAALARPGFITGTVARVGDGIPVAGATVAAAPHRREGGGRTTTDENGAYRLALSPTVYDVTASAFGYESATVSAVVVTTDTTTVVDFSLTPLPTGVLRGRVTDAATGRPLTATVSVVDTPLATSAGTYSFTLPAGTYVLRSRRLGYRVVTATATVAAGHVTVADLALPPAPSILLVDSGPWYYGSQAGYLRQALDDLA